MCGKSDSVFASTFNHNCRLVFITHQLNTAHLHVFCLPDFPPKKGAELDKMFQDLEDLLKI